MAEILLEAQAAGNLISERLGWQGGGGGGRGPLGRHLCCSGVSCAIFLEGEVSLGVRIEKKTGAKWRMKN